MPTQIIKIYSENNAFQHLETLSRNREKRHKNREFLVEGVRSINAALQFKWSFNAFIYSAQKPLSTWANNLLQNSPAKTHYDLPLTLLQKISAKTDTSELLALIEIPADDLQKIPLKKDALILIFDRPSNPGNLGTIIRSADALGADGLIISGHSVDLYDPEVIRASTGSFFSLPIVRLTTTQALQDWLKTLPQTLKHLQIVGTDEKAATNITQHNFQKPTILLIGNETSGLSNAYQALCQTLVKIPMSAQAAASSLNVACATTAILYEINRQRTT